MIPSHVILFILILFICIMGVNSIVNYVGEKNWEESPNEVFDFGWKYLPDLHQFEPITNIIPLALLISLFFIKRGDSILYEFLLKFVLILILRALTTIATILPKHEKCEVTFDTYSLINGSCYDKIFSGHTAFVALMTLIFYENSIISLPLFWLLNIISMFIIVSVRSHYSVDVILGFILTYFVWDGNYDILKSFHL